MGPTSFFTRVTATIFVVGIAALCLQSAIGASRETIESTVTMTVAGFFFCGVVAIVCSIWEAR
jgi:hypothetical protein